MGEAFKRKRKKLGEASVAVESHDLDVLAAIVLAAPAGPAVSACDSRPDLDRVSL